ncbi:Chaperone protein HtpG [Planctomycetes bacterium Pla163]|uniref:Chaperone protein HtpG n=1 Tax=Rohdeia mirabilis TaxID=2528008 RepID=A0A518CY51_9BACT|nr:Chaperone protein HtpG [Planctomycetes bacterium Pla163]
MSPSLRRIPFRVEMAGVIEIMGRSLYSDRATPIRELIQNAHDSIRRRRDEELDYTGAIRIRADANAGTLEFEDDGIGLDEAEAERYLGTVGVSLTGAIKGDAAREGASSALIGQFGIGLLSAFLIADRIEVHSRRGASSQPVTWIAGRDADILVGPGERAERGTSVRLHLRPDALEYAADLAKLEEVVRRYAEYLEVPIHIGDSQRRVNLARASWLEPTPDDNEIQTDLAERFSEEPLAVLTVQDRGPTQLRGAVYVSPERTPGFTSEATVHATLKRMLISTSVRGLVPSWAPFLRGVLELTNCTPTASREDLVRDAAFRAARERLEELAFEWFERLGREDDVQWQAICEWHRYTLTGSALDTPRLRAVLRTTLRWSTSAGPLTFDELLARSQADPLRGESVDHVVWFNTERRQERWVDSAFRASEAPCVHCLRSFELTLLTALVRDANAAGGAIDLRPAKLESDGFADSVLEIRDHGPIDDVWQRFLGIEGTRVFTGRGSGAQPCLALLDERGDLARSFAALRGQGRVPAGFQALIDRELDTGSSHQNEVLLDLAHPLVRRALERSCSHPLAHVLRVQVAGALEAAGARLGDDAQRTRLRDLEWVAEALP